MALYSSALSRLNPQVQKQFAFGWKPQTTTKTASAPAPAPAPAAPSTPAPPSLPWDSLAQAQVDSARQNYTVTSGNLDAQENALGIDWGVKYGRKVDPTTGLQQIDTASATLDYSNPYSKASLLKKAYEQGQASTSGNLASRGQLYSGYLQTKLGQGDSNFAQGNDSLLKGFGQQALGIYGQRYAAWKAAQDAPISAQGDAITRHAGDPQPETPAAPTNAPAPAAPQNALAALIAKYGGQNVKWDERGVFYKRPSDGKWIPVR